MKSNGKTTQVNVKNLLSSPQKLRLVVDVVRGKPVTKALDILKMVNKKASDMVIKAIKSGVANASTTYNISAENLKISKIVVDEAPSRGWRRFGSKGRYSRIERKRSHLSLELSEK